MRRATLIALLQAAALLACGPGQSSEGGPADATPGDAGFIDAGAVDVDAGEVDAGEADAGEADAGPIFAGGPLAFAPGRGCAVPIGGGGKAFIELGHTRPIGAIAQTPSRMLTIAILQSNPGKNEWLLWDRTTGSRVATGLSDSLPQLAGDTVTATEGTSAHFFSATTGALKATVSWVQPPSIIWLQTGLAQDGSYFYVIDTTGLHVFSTADGRELFAKTGINAKQSAFAAPGELVLAPNPLTTPYSLEHLSVPSGTSRRTPTFGQGFERWFDDGSHFLARIGANIFVFTLEAELVASSAGDTYDDSGGRGDYFWVDRLPVNPSPTNRAHPVSLYRIGTNAPISTTGFSLPEIASTELGVVVRNAEPRAFTFFPFAQPTQPQTLALPSETHVFQIFIGADENTVVGSYSGSLFTASAPTAPLKALTCGAALSLAGSAAGTAIVATGAGDNLVLDLRGTAREIVATFPKPASRVALSDDARVLAFVDAELPDPAQAAAHVVALPSGATLGSWLLAQGSLGLQDLQLSRSGTRVGLVWGGGAGQPFGRWTAPDGTGSTDLSGTYSRGWLLSPSGARVAAGDGLPPGGITTLFRNGMLTGGLTGIGVGWLDDEKLLVANYTQNPFQGNVLTFTGSVIVDDQGRQLATSPLPELHAFERVDAHRVYSPALHAVYDVDSGAKVWTPSEPSNGKGVVVGTQLLYAHDHVLVAEPIGP